MKFGTFTRFGAVAAMSAAMCGGVLADDVEGKAKIGDAEGKASINLQDDRDLSTSRDLDRTRAELKTTTDNQVTRINKASSLTGMQVVNNQKEKLGDIKDIVMDLPTGKVSYVVLSVGGFLGIGDKLIAVPPSAFTVSTTGDSLILDADKAKIEAAPGFVQTAWPDVNDPQFSSYWKVTDRESVGGATSTETGRQRSTDRDTDLDRKDSSTDRLNENKD